VCGWSVVWPYTSEILSWALRLGKGHGSWRVLTDKGSVYDLMHADALAYSGWE
jgi:hypothetical protein